MTEAQSKIIAALDVPTANEARNIVAELREHVGAFKIGLQLFTAEGVRFVRELTDSGVKIFLDLKFHDIPNTVAAASVEAARTGVWLFNLHAAGGAEMMRRTMEKVREASENEGFAMPKIIAVTVLTSSNETTLRETGVSSSPLEQVLRLARLTENCGLNGIVCSPLEAAQIRREIPSSDFLLVTPGVRDISPDNAAAFDDQKRVLSAGEAVAAGSSYIVVGRPILQAENRPAAVARIAESIENCAMQK